MVNSLYELYQEKMICHIRIRIWAGVFQRILGVRNRECLLLNAFDHRLALWLSDKKAGLIVDMTVYQMKAVISIFLCTNWQCLWMYWRNNWTGRDDKMISGMFCLVFVPDAVKRQHKQ